MPEEKIITILGLGSNIGERHALLKRAIDMLAAQNVLEAIIPSSLYESDALLLPDSPPEWNIPFLNMAVKGTTSLTPHQLLVAVKHIEHQLGRLERGRWSPREIDIDILCYGTAYLQEETLQLPHAALLQRSFALIPFAELWPEWQYPLPGLSAGKTAANLVAQLPGAGADIRKVFE